MPTIDEITIADEPASWAALGFALDDGACELAGVTLRLAGLWRGRRDRRLVAARPAQRRARRPADGDLDCAARAPAPAHPNGVVEIDHVVAVSPALERSVAAFEQAGLDLRRVREEPTPAGAPRQAFFRLGREILELVQEPDEVVASNGGPERPVHFWGLALLVEDIDRTVEMMAPHARPAREAVQPGRRISTLARSAGLAIPLALMSRQEDPRALAQ